MNESESDRLADCVECGATISISLDRGYALGRDRVLCFECARRRGGRFDEGRDDWVSAPEIADLPDGAEL